jgi:hypothetical protein
MISVQTHGKVEKASNSQCDGYALEPGVHWPNVFKVLSDVFQTESPLLLLNQLPWAYGPRVQTQKVNFGQTLKFACYCNNVLLSVMDLTVMLSSPSWELGFTESLLMESTVFFRPHLP